MLCKIRTVQIQSRKICARSCGLHGSHPATWARSYRSYRSYRSGIYLPCLPDLDHNLGINDLSDVSNVTTAPMFRVKNIWSENFQGSLRERFFILGSFPAGLTTGNHVFVFGWEPVTTGTLPAGTTRSRHGNTREILYGNRGNFPEDCPGKFESRVGNKLPCARDWVAHDALWWVPTWSLKLSSAVRAIK